MTDKLHCPWCGDELIFAHKLKGIQTCVCRNTTCKYDSYHFPVEVIRQLIDGKKAQDALKNSREKLAAFMHDTWADWFVYQFNNSTVENIQRWQIQSNLPYSSLTEEDKDKDRKFADKIISIITKQEARK